MIKKVIKKWVRDRIDIIIQNTIDPLNGRLYNSEQRYQILKLNGNDEFVLDMLSLEQVLERLPKYCYSTYTVSQSVYDAIEAERQHQKDKWGEFKEQSLPGFLLVLRKELEEAELGWVKNLEGRNSPLAEIVQIAATCIACLEKYGVTGSAIATDDIAQS